MQAPDLWKQSVVVLAGYFLVTFALTWTTWLASTAFVARTSTEALFGVGGPFFLVGVFAPALVAIAFTARQGGRAAVSQLVSGIGRWQLPIRWYLFALAYFAVIKLTAAVIHRGATGAWPVFGDEPWPLMLGAILPSTLVQAGEEVGWRGFALPRLADHLGLGGASLLLGALWAAWHLPLFFLPGADSYGQSFPLYLLHVMALSVAMAWLFWRTERSLLLVMLMHAAVNNTTGIVPSASAGSSNPWSFDGSLVGWIAVGVSWVVAAVMLVQMRGVWASSAARIHWDRDSGEPPGIARPVDG